MLELSIEQLLVGKTYTSGSKKIANRSGQFVAMSGTIVSAVKDYRDDDDVYRIQYKVEGNITCLEWAKVRVNKD